MDHDSIGLREYIGERLDNQDRLLERIHAEVKATNGRVRALEKAVAVLQVGYGLGAFITGSAFVALVSWVLSR